MALPVIGTVLSEIFVLLAFALLLMLTWKFGKFIFKVIFGILSNTVLGFVTLFLVNYFFGLEIPFTFPVIVATALFGLPGVGTMIVLAFLGIAL